MNLLRQAGLRVNKDYLGKNLKGQMKLADKMKAAYCFILGDNELERGIGVLKNMSTGEQEEISLAQAVDLIKERI